MKLQFEKKETCSLYEIRNGECFTLPDKLEKIYMKSNDYSVHDKTRIRCICIETGCVIELDNDGKTKVYPIESRIIVSPKSLYGEITIKRNTGEQSGFE